MPDAGSLVLSIMVSIVGFAFFNGFEGGVGPTVILSGVPGVCRELGELVHVIFPLRFQEGMEVFGRGLRACSIGSG